jgi:hypothetical protein
LWGLIWALSVTGFLFDVDLRPSGSAHAVRVYTGVVERFDDERDVQVRIERRASLPLEVVARGDRSGIGIEPQPVPAGVGGAHDELVVAGRVDVELVVVQCVAELL